MPCYKLGIRFFRPHRYHQTISRLSERSGFYLAVLKEGEVGVGDEFQLTMRNEPSVTVNEVTRLYSRDRGNVELLRRAVAVEALPESWRTYFQDQLDKI